MAYGSYATWQDVKAFLDTAVYTDGEPGSEPGPIPAEPATLQALVDTETQRFENLVRGAIKVPIDEDDSPDTFEQAKTVIATAVAAGYARTLCQSEGRFVQAWFYEWLEKKGSDAMQSMMVPHQAPEDAEDPAHPTEYLPRASVIEGSSETPLFSQAQITTGSGHW